LAVIDKQVYFGAVILDIPWKPARSKRALSRDSRTRTRRLHSE
jgi:hypothetical protein